MGGTTPTLHPLVCGQAKTETFGNANLFFDRGKNIKSRQKLLIVSGKTNIKTLRKQIYFPRFQPTENGHLKTH